MLQSHASLLNERTAKREKLLALHSNVWPHSANRVSLLDSRASSAGEGVQKDFGIYWQTKLWAAGQHTRLSFHQTFHEQLPRDEGWKCLQFRARLALPTGKWLPNSHHIRARVRQCLRPATAVPYKLAAYLHRSCSSKAVPVQTENWSVIKKLRRSLFSLQAFPRRKSLNGYLRNGGELNRHRWSLVDFRGNTTREHDLLLQAL